MAGTSCKLSCRSTLRAPLCCLRLVDETITIGSGPGIIGKGEGEEGAGSRRRGDRETISDRGAGSGEDASRMTGTGTGEMRKVGRGERFETISIADSRSLSKVPRILRNIIRRKWAIGAGGKLYARRLEINGGSGSKLDREGLKVSINLKLPTTGHPSGASNMLK
ncbi:hypothetical protein DMN91_001440 [Ooceraea biroi]|uniref:Uncharacterized protein n=1 Tax=Ooceraea biroi TaxID=2015173 RepID=A0A3L8E4U9_OOCBI|nr:hypothetical protein DMN91_001440 [Ooceraea biroi]